MGQASKTVLFHVTAGQGQGTGNVIRCHSLASLLPAGTGVAFHLAASPPETRAWLQARCPVVQDLRHDLPQPDIVVFDRQDAAEDQRESLEELRSAWPTSLIVALDHYYRHHDELLDGVINLYDGHDTDWPQGAPRCAYAEGLTFAIVRHDIVALRPCQPSRAAEVRRILVTFGGEDPRNNTATLVQALDDVAPKQSTITVVLGLAHPHREEVLALVKATARYTKIIEFTSQFGELLRQSDLVICGGGTTMLESCCLGVPRFGVPQHDRERAFLRSFEQAGAIPDQSLSEAWQDMNILGRTIASATERRELARRGMETIDGQGAQRIIDLLFEWHEERR
jgi:spore coat polysaccharide biosynthesis predicted glycosyltransferase SpsG